MNILITGARGFMGKNLRSALTGRYGDARFSGNAAPRIGWT